MESQVQIAGHAAHPILVNLPLGLWFGAILFDIVGIASGNFLWPTMSFYMVGVGILGALAAAAPGLIDAVAIPPPTRAKWIAKLHGVGNVLVVLLFLASWLLRWPALEPPSRIALGVEGAGGALLLLTAWLGGELFEQLGVGVSQDANLDAPSSLGVRGHRLPSGSAQGR
jgi:uncharacterized membrane protein